MLHQQTSTQFNKNAVPPAVLLGAIKNKNKGYDLKVSDDGGCSKKSDIKDYSTPARKSPEPSPITDKAPTLDTETEQPLSWPTLNQDHFPPKPPLKRRRQRK